MASFNFQLFYNAIDRGDIGTFRNLMLQHPKVEKHTDATLEHFRISKPGNFLHRACESGHLAIVVLLVAEFKYSVDCQLEEEGYPIHIACRHKHMDIVEYLLTFPNQVNLQITSYSGDNPLILACKNRDLNMVKCVVEKGAKYESSGSGSTPLSFVEDDKDIIQYLFEKFPLNSADIPWKQFITSNNASLLEYCTSHCSDSEFKNYALIYQAASTSKTTAAEVLLKAGVNINIAVGGWTPLIVAARKKPPSKDMVILLLEWGVDRSAKSSSGKTAQELAASEGNHEIAEIIANFNPSNSATRIPDASQSPPKKQKSDTFQYTSQLEILTQMGFEKESAKVALVANNGNVEQATNALLQ